MGRNGMGRGIGGVLVCIVLLTGCFAAAPLPTPVVPPTQPAQPTLTASILPTVTPISSRTATPRPQPSATAASLRSHFTSYTNANFVRALLVAQDGTLWSGGSGGVVAWNVTDGTYKKYTSEDGLDGNSVNAIAQAPDGALWFGTNAGVSRYLNGAWTTVLSGKGISALAATPSGVVWAISRGKLMSFDGILWLNEDVSATALACAPDGSIWAAGSGNVYHYDGAQWTTIPYPAVNGNSFKVSDLNVNALVVDSKGTVWVGTDVALHRYNGRSWSSFNPWKDLQEIGVLSLSVDPMDVIWIGLGNMLGEPGSVDQLASLGMYRFDGAAWNFYPIKDGVLRSEVFAMTWSRDGWGYFGYHGQGISRFDGHDWASFLTKDPLPSNAIGPLAVSSTGVVWAGSDDGIARLDGQVWIVYDDFDGMGTDVRALAIASDETIWASGQGVVVHLRNDVMSTDPEDWVIDAYPAVAGSWSRNVQTIACLPSGRIFFGGTESTLYDGHTWTTISQISPQERIGLTLVSSDASLWAWGNGTPGGLYHTEGQVWHHLGNIFSSVDALGVAPGGAIWLGGTLDGAARYDGKDWVRYTTENGLPSNTVRAILVTHDGLVWFGTDVGLVRYDGATWTTLTTEDGLADNLIFSLAAAPDGSLWIATHAGLSHYVP
jgi:ligand-binding sensor domain-containing protein